MLSRVISGIVLAVGIFAVLLMTPWWGFGIVLILTGLQCASEYIRMARPDSQSAERIVFICVSSLVVCYPLIAKVVPWLEHGIALMLGFVILAISHLSRPHPIDGALNRLSLDVCGMAYLGVTLPLVLQLRDQPNGGWLVLLAMVITFGSDTGAYFAGRFLGRHKLYPSVSPKKTIEGAVGGIGASIGGTFLIAHYVEGMSFLTPIHCVLLGGIGACFAVIGDLVESLMKRAFGVKDSGQLIPGHGGLLDRIDGLIFCGPFVWFYLRIIA